MRVALVSPYSHGYPGGVARHVEALAEELFAHGHEVRLLAPDDPDDRLTRLLHGGLRPERRARPDYLVPLGRTLAVRANGARSNLACTLDSVGRVSRALRQGRFDVVHVHEPNAPLASWCAVEQARSPLVGTFHAHSTSRTVNVAAANLVGARRLYNKLGVRIAVSEWARWTAERFYGGSYRVIPNGVDLAAARAAAGRVPSSGAGSPRSPVDFLYLGRAEQRKGLPVLGRALEELRAGGLDVRLTVAGADQRTARALLGYEDGVSMVGPVSDEEKWRILASAHVLVAPSLGAESFGMVLAEALAVGTPVVCSAIPGYSEIVRDGVEGLLVPPGDPDALAAALSALAVDEARRRELAQAARARAERYAWPQVARAVVGAYEEAVSLPGPASTAARAAARAGLRPADRRALQGSLARDLPRTPAGPRGSHPRRPSRGAAIGTCLALVVAALVAARAGPGAVAGLTGALLAAPLWPLAAVALMIVSLLTRAGAWHAILRASLGDRPVVRHRDTARATMIGVLMSATLPARLGEASRAVVVARALGRVSERLPLVAGTIVSQTVLNLLVLAVLGSAVLATAALPDASERGIALMVTAAGGGLLLVVAATALTRAGRSGRCLNRFGRAVSLTSRLREGLRVFADPRLGALAAGLQAGAWALQILACYALLVAFGLGPTVGLAGAGAVLFAVNAAGALPGLPSNLGVFQAACVAVLAVHGVGYAPALAYGIALQALELAVAVALGVPALMREGVGWTAMRERALLSVAPVTAASTRGG